MRISISTDFVRKHENIDIMNNAKKYVSATWQPQCVADIKCLPYITPPALTLLLLGKLCNRPKFNAARKLKRKQINEICVKLLMMRKLLWFSYTEGLFCYNRNDCRLGICEQSVEAHAYCMIEQCKWSSRQQQQTQPVRHPKCIYRTWQSMCAEYCTIFTVHNRNLSCAIELDINKCVFTIVGNETCKK